MTKCQQDSNDGAWSSIAGSSRHRPFAPASGDIFATRKEVKVAGTIDGQPFQATLLPTGDGTHRGHGATQSCTPKDTRQGNRRQRGCAPSAASQLTVKPVIARHVL